MNKRLASLQYELRAGLCRTQPLPLGEFQRQAEDSADELRHTRSGHGISPPLEASRSGPRLHAQRRTAPRLSQLQHPYVASGIAGY